MAKKERKVVTQFVTPKGASVTTDVKRPEGNGWRHQNTNTFPVGDKVAISSYYVRTVHDSADDED